MLLRLGLLLCHAPSTAAWCVAARPRCAPPRAASPRCAAEVEPGEPPSENLFFGAKYGEEAAEHTLREAGYTVEGKPAEPTAPSSASETEEAAAEAAKLAERLQGCSIYVLGLGTRKTAIARALASRLGNYRQYDVSQLMLTTVKALNPDAEAVSLRQLVAEQPLADVEALARAVLGEVQPYKRSVFVAWDGSVDTQDFMVMQQGLVVNLQYDATADEVALPSAEAAETLARWSEGHAKADVTVALPKDAAADAAVREVCAAVTAYVDANPSKSGAWKSKADEALGRQ